MMNHRPNSQHIFGAEIQYFRLEPKYWEPILLQLKEAGLKCVTTYVQWGTHLVGPPDGKNPAGVLDFEGRTDPKLNLFGFLDLVQKHGLELNFRCGPFCCNEMEFGGYPKWLVCGDPSMMVWDHQNRTTQGYWIARKEGSQPSYLHPVYLDWCRRWLAEVDAIIAPRLASRGGFITMVNLDNEVSYIVKDSFLDSDYNPVNTSRGGFYHQFLKEKYGSMEALPYQQKVSEIEDIDPPREVPVSFGNNAAWYLDWVEFKEWCMCRYLSEIRAMHVANGVEDVMFMTNFNPHLPEGVPTRMPSFEKAVQGKTGRGIVGYDFYRGTFLSWSGYSSMARVLRLMNASVDYTWSAEFMSGTWEKILSSRVSDDHMRFMARCALANGCKALAWFMFHDRRVWGDCPVGAHGHRRPSWEVLRETYALCSSLIPHWDQLEVRGDCAVIYDVLHHRHTAVGDPSPCNDSASHVGLPLWDGIPAGAASLEYYGLHRVIEAGGHQPLVVDIAAQPERLGLTNLAFYPGSPAATRSGSVALREWIEQGGTLFVSGPWPSHDESGRSLNFLDLSGPPEARQKVGAGAVIHCARLGDSEPGSESLESIDSVRKEIKSAGMWHVALELTSPVSWEQWGSGGGVTNAATKLGGPALNNIESVVEHRVQASAVLHEGGGFPVLFVLNHFPEPAELRVHLNSYPSGRLRNLDTNEEIPITGGRVQVDLDRKSAAVFGVIY
jgi:hypothetical protein